MFTVRWTIKASDALAASLLHIAEDDPTIALKIAKAVHAWVGRLAIFPHLGTQMSSRKRRYKLVIPKYPFTCYYHVRGDSIFILAFRHHKQKPLE